MAGYLGLGMRFALPQFFSHGAKRGFSVSRTAPATWGFIGLGRMGYPMAKNLRANTPSADLLLVSDVNPTATSSFLDEHRAVASDATPGRPVVEAVGTAREVAERSDTIITVLPEPSHVRGVFNSILSPALPNPPTSRERLFIDCSTIDPSTSKGVANAVHSTQQSIFVDAPMSGGVVGAKAGTLTFMLGASDEIVSRVRPVLSMMGRSVHHCGAQGAGLSAKLANNYLLAIINIATAEAMNLGVRSGLDPKVLAGLINASTGKTWCSEVNNPVPGVVEAAPSSKDYAGGFGVSLMEKDLRLAISTAKEIGAGMVLHERALALYQDVKNDEKCAGRDFSVVYRHLGGIEPDH